MGIGSEKFIEIGSIRLGDGVAWTGRGDAPAVEDDEEDGIDHGR